MEEEGEVHRRGPLVPCPFGGEEYCCVDDPFGLDSHQQMYATYRREYENATHLPDESIDALFQRITVAVNNMRANVDVLPYDDHDRAVKLLHLLDHTVWGGKFEAIVESEKYDTLTINELFSKLKSAEVDRSMTAKIEGLTDSHSLALISGPKGKSNANPSTRMFSLSSDVCAR
jgi:hypothetical protein